MKKLILLALVFVFIIGLFAIGFAADEPDPLYIRALPPFQMDRDDIPYKTAPINKLERGVINMATFWLELPAEVAKVTKEQDPLAGVTIGVVNGVITSVVRGGTAIFDTSTFFIPSYTKPALKPEYAYQAADKKIRALLW